MSADWSIVGTSDEEWDSAFSDDDVEALEELSPARRDGHTADGEELRSALGALAKRRNYTVKFRENGKYDFTASLESPDDEAIVVSTSGSIEGNSERLVEQLAAEIARSCGPQVITANHEFVQLVLPKQRNEN